MGNYEKTPWLHVYGQYLWHHSAVIRGTKPGLLTLRDAIDKAIENGAQKLRFLQRWRRIRD